MIGSMSADGSPIRWTACCYLSQRSPPRSCSRHWPRLRGSIQYELLNRASGTSGELRLSHAYAIAHSKRVGRTHGSSFVVHGRRFMVSNNDFEKANQRAKDLQSDLPRAISVHYDRKSRRIVVDLSSKLTLSFSPDDAQGLEDAKPSQLNEIEITPSGFGIHFPKLDADLYVPGLLEGFLGSRQWMAARLGQAGGQSTSTAKRSAARANGRLGGRPQKAARG